MSFRTFQGIFLLTMGLLYLGLLFYRYNEIDEISRWLAIIVGILLVAGGTKVLIDLRK